MIGASGASGRPVHPADGDLVRLLDGVGRGPNDERVASHVRLCPVCLPRVEVLGRRSSNFSNLLRSTATIDWLPTVPPASARKQPRGVSWRRIGYIAAASLLVISAAASPVRAWIATEFGRLTGRLPATSAVPVPRPPENDGVVSVTFPQRTGVLLFWLDALPAGGSLEIRTTAASNPTAELLDRDGREELVVMPSGIRVHNDSASVARYRLTIPASTLHLRVRIGRNGLDTTLTVPAAGSRLDFNSPSTR